MVSAAVRPALLRVAFVALILGPTAVILALHCQPDNSTPAPAAMPTTTAVAPPVAPAWEIPTCGWPDVDIASRPDTPPGMAVELPSTSSPVPTITHAAFRPTVEDRGDFRQRLPARSMVLYDPARDLHSYPPRNMNQMLAAAPEVILLPPTDRSVQLFKERQLPGDQHPVLTYFDNRADLAGLPVLRDDDCRQAEKRAGNFAETAKKLRSLCALVQKGINSPYTNTWRSDFRQAVQKLPPEQVAPLMLQMLQCEPPPLRRFLVAFARTDPRPETTRILAHRAVYETDAAVRREAVEALAGRTPDAARPLLLAALRHPWPFIADQAAAALIALNDQTAVPALVDLLAEPAPTAPFRDDHGNRMVREVVRINHAHNCQLCHAPSWDANDPARVSVPSPTELLPPSFSVQYYSQGDLLVRADVTYLRQDFSMTLPVPDPGPWPREQRFDFFVRTRPAIAAEAEKRSRGPGRHRAAIVRALRAITGTDLGETAEEWRVGLRAARKG